MALELVTKHLDWVRTLPPAEDRALRAVKAGEADEEQQAVCLAMLNAARDADDRVPGSGVRALRRPSRYPAGRAGRLMLPRQAA